MEQEEFDLEVRKHIKKVVGNNLDGTNLFELIRACMNYFGDETVDKILNARNLEKNIPDIFYTGENGLRKSIKGLPLTTKEWLLKKYDESRLE